MSLIGKEKVPLRTTGRGGKTEDHQSFFRGLGLGPSSPEETPHSHTNGAARTRNGSAGVSAANSCAITGTRTPRTKIPGIKPYAPFAMHTATETMVAINHSPMDGNVQSPKVMADKIAKAIRPNTTIKA